MACLVKLFFSWWVWVHCPNPCVFVLSWLMTHGGACYFFESEDGSKALLGRVWKPGCCRTDARADHFLDLVGKSSSEAQVPFSELQYHLYIYIYTDSNWFLNWSKSLRFNYFFSSESLFLLLFEWRHSFRSNSTKQKLHPKNSMYGIIFIYLTYH